MRGGWRGWPRPALFAAGGVALLAFLILGLRLGLGADGIEPVPPPSLPPPPVEVPETAPVELPTGEVRIDAVPWGELMEIAAADGVLQPLPDGGQAPLRFRLPTGRYRISLHHPEAASPVPCEVEVTAGGVARCDAVLYEPDALTYFKAVGWWQ
ncbi:MAG: hypothetical protein D6696_03755 [Acidobacteria bacterium]|nr:MAG: hypothetical protein D6696_03755 [Acidobacteriota bacterium]